MTTTEAAARLNLSKRRVIDFIRAGRIRAVRHGWGWWIEEVDLEAFAALDRVPHRKRREAMQEAADAVFGTSLGKVPPVGGKGAD